MYPSTLSATDFDCGMYVFVLCPSQNPLLSRICAHLPCLAGVRAHLLCQGRFWSRAYTSMYYAQLQNPLLSRIWTHLVRLAGIHRICNYLLCQQRILTVACTSMYYATNQIPVFVYLGTSPAPYGFSEELKFNSAFTKSKSSIIIK